MRLISTSSNTFIAAPIPVGSTPTDIAITPDGSRAYVTNANASTVSVISTITNTFIANIPLGNVSIAIAFTPRCI
ncbi:YncE family protein [Bacillus wiedmannii]|uniref:YncE family protein n=1 Tax=Bacillus wiedmannii TaxID=1890302 RepID=UPI003CED24D4